MKKRMLFCMLIGFSVVTVFSAHGAPKKSQRRKFNWSKLIPKIPHIPQVSMALPSIPSVAVSNPFADQHAVLASDRKPARWKVLLKRFARNARKSARSSVNGALAVGPNTIQYVRSKECKRMVRRAVINTAYYGFWYGIPAVGFLGGLKYLGDRQQKNLDQMAAHEAKRAADHAAETALLQTLQGQVRGVGAEVEGSPGTAAAGAAAPDARIGAVDTRTQAMERYLQALVQELQQANGVAVGDYADDNAAIAYFKRCMTNKHVELEQRLESGTFEVAKERVLVNDADGTRYTIVPILVKEGRWRGPNAQDIWNEKKRNLQDQADQVYNPPGADSTTVVLAPYCIESSQVRWLNR